MANARRNIDRNVVKETPRTKAGFVAVRFHAGVGNARKQIQCHALALRFSMFRVGRQKSPATTQYVNHLDNLPAAPISRRMTGRRTLLLIALLLAVLSVMRVFAESELRAHQKEWRIVNPPLRVQ
jgi:hypothetical protein